MGTLGRLPGITWRKVGMTSNHHAPYVQGYRRAIMADIKRREPVRGSKSPKSVSVHLGYKDDVEEVFSGEVTGFVPRLTQ